MSIFSFKEDYTLENDRVLLRPLEDQDFQLLIKFAENEPEIWQYSLINGAGADNLKKYIALALEDKERNASYPFIVFDKVTKQYAGTTRFYDYQPVHNTSQLGYTWYGKDFQGTGLNKHCKYLMLEFAFEIMKLQRLEFRADNNNKRSIAAMKSIGCIEEGILRSNCASLDGRRDSIILSILRDEWEGGVKEMLAAKIKL